MKTQKELLNHVLSEISDLKLMIEKIHTRLSEIQFKKNDNSEEFDRSDESSILTVNEDLQIWEYNSTSIILNSTEKTLINEFVHFSIRGECLNDENDEFNCFVIWEFNQPNGNQLIVSVVDCDINGKAMHDLRDRLYDGQICQNMISFSPKSMIVSKII